MANYTLSSNLLWNSVYESLTISTESRSNSTFAPSYNITLSPTDCVVLDLQDFNPSNNPDNIVTQEQLELIMELIFIFFLPILFLIGCPANIINMAVFYKQGLKERINVCLFALSLADEFYLLNNMLWYGDQFYLRFTTKEMFGPVLIFLINNYLLGFHGFIWVSQILSALIASERCFCIMQPLRFQTFLKTSTTTGIIIVVNVVVLAAVSFVLMRYHVSCSYDPQSGSTKMAFISSEFYIRYQSTIDSLEVFVLGLGLPGLVIIVVVTTTILTAIKLRQAANWRAETSSCAVSQRDIALTKMLVVNSILFIVCAFPFIVFRFIFLFMPEVNPGRRKHNFFMVIQFTLLFFSYFNATFNIVVYYTMGSRYRQTFWQLFRCIKRNEKTSQAHC